MLRFNHLYFHTVIGLRRGCGLGIRETGGVCETEHRFMGPLSERPCQDARKHSQKRVKKPNPLPLLLPNPGQIQAQKELGVVNQR